MIPRLPVAWYFHRLMFHIYLLFRVPAFFTPVWYSHYLAFLYLPAVSCFRLPAFQWLGDSMPRLAFPYLPVIPSALVFLHLPGICSTWCFHYLAFSLLVFPGDSLIPSPSCSSMLLFNLLHGFLNLHHFKLPWKKFAGTSSADVVCVWVLTILAFRSTDTWGSRCGWDNGIYKKTMSIMIKNSRI